MSGGHASVRICSAGVTLALMPEGPAIFPILHRAKEPAGRRRYKNPASPWELDKFHFAPQIRRERSTVGSQLLCVFALLVMLVTSGCGKRGEETIVVGSKNFTEQIVLAELFAQQIEAHTALRVERRLNLGGTFICHDALVSGTVSYTHLTLPTICSV